MTDRELLEESEAPLSISSDDGWARMTTATKSGLVVGDEVALSYDALGRTVSKRAGLKTTTYGYVGTSEELAVATVATALGSSATSYAHGPAGPLAEDAGAGVRFYLNDPHGDIVGLANSSGAAVGTRTFSPWGETRQASGETSALGFQGDPLDADTGLYDLGTRFYDPGLGRFSTRDVLLGNLTSPMSLNQYAYGYRSPLRYTDPTGMVPQDGGGGGPCTKKCKKNGAEQGNDSSDPQPEISTRAKPAPTRPRPPEMPGFWSLDTASVWLAKAWPTLVRASRTGL